jgi:hypothetical protein
VIVGAVADPLKWDRWPEAEALLEPARQRGRFESVIEPDEALYVVLDGDELLACATAWLGEREGEKLVEVKLVGGSDYRRWIGELDKVIGAAASQAGAARMVAIGRAGWAKALRPHGWAQLQSVEDHWLFERKLERGQPAGEGVP